jgi:DNA-directed RNA polymerase sigma subunit (sigma70/sigma32)
MKSSTGTLSDRDTHEFAKTLGVKPEEVREMEMRLSGGSQP